MALKFRLDQAEFDALPESTRQVYLEVDPGNYMLNVAPMGDGTIPDDQQASLLAMGEWLHRNGEAVYGSKPWLRPGEGPGVPEEAPSGSTVLGHGCVRQRELGCRHREPPVWDLTESSEGYRALVRVRHGAPTQRGRRRP